MTHLVSRRKAINEIEEKAKRKDEQRPYPLKITTNRKRDKVFQKR